MAQPRPFPVACFAPPLTDEALARYRRLVDAVDQASPLRDALEGLWRCVAAWWELPESARTDGDRVKFFHRDRPDAGWAERVVQLVPLESVQVQALWDVTPWMDELDRLSNGQATGLFDGLQGELRDCAFHLLWHAREITLDREPLTSDRLK